MSDLIIVTFRKEWRGYAIGETAGFDGDAAEVLIESGRATLYAAPKPVEKTGRASSGRKGAGERVPDAPDKQEVAAAVDPIEPIDPVDAIAPVEQVDPIDPDEKP
ncbi:hypothetical protein [Pseudomonas akapageensis]|uniref:hypothetical protein n=1 Tax=Pseudomonas akapageensis TaxID=2609961 RepID=UPI00140D3CBA|nr:hypothetical protein [Pseudomonas akapageensis]